MPRTWVIVEDKEYKCRHYVTELLKDDKLLGVDEEIWCLNLGYTDWFDEVPNMVNKKNTMRRILFLIMVVPVYPYERFKFRNFFKNDPFSMDNMDNKIRSAFTDAVRYWEKKRIIYNIGLAFIVCGYFIYYMLQSTDVISFDSILMLFVLSVLANVVYSYLR